MPKVCKHETITGPESGIEESVLSVLAVTSTPAVASTVLYGSSPRLTQIAVSGPCAQNLVHSCQFADVHRGGQVPHQVNPSAADSIAGPGSEAALRSFGKLLCSLDASR